MYRADTVVHLLKLNPIDTTANWLSQHPEDLLIDPTEDRLWKFLDNSQTDSEDNSLETSLPTQSPNGNGTYPTNESITDVTRQRSPQLKSTLLPLLELLIIF